MVVKMLAPLDLQLLGRRVRLDEHLRRKQSSMNPKLG